MDAPSPTELNSVLQAGLRAALAPGDCVVHWHSTFGLVIIEVRGGQVFVNGDPVAPAASEVPLAGAGQPFSSGRRNE